MADIAQASLSAHRRPRLRDLFRGQPLIALAAIDAAALFAVSALTDPALGLLPAAHALAPRTPGAYLPVVLLIALLCLDGAYRAPAVAHPGRVIRRIVLLWILVQFFVLATAYSAGVDVFALEPRFLVLAAIAPLALLPQRLIFYWLAKRAAPADQVSAGKIFRIAETGALPLGDAQADEAFVFPSFSDADPALLRRLSEAISRSDCEEIHILAREGAVPQNSALLRELRGVSLPVRLIASPSQSELLRYPVSRFGAGFAFDLQKPRIDLFDRLIKRGFDLSTAYALLLFFAPLMLVVAGLIRTTSAGPILFRQSRVGRDGRLFTIYKFRTMTVQENGPSVRQATKNDPRVTPLGRFLRRTSIDELPQLLNVVRGDMSLVGPRPHAVAHDEAFEGVVPDYRLRRLMKPGLTGLAQISGCRGEITSQAAIERRVALDVEYIERWSPGLDVQIILKTFSAVVRPVNAY